ncbi:DUF2975 domain-containing protein [uncultured Dysosmobacter sp.]|uniref:DUF2975 domain-containing protein n=1 Tax=uncultured Dysosmobacter sp. TaxID=2591384 RepID=UPI0026383998|nr:DUF2975 domain-containing protein [uncultured Dysosmobacter sp.]
MDSTAVQKIAKILNILVIIALVCNIVILYLIPTAVFVSGKGGLLEGVRAYLGGILFPGEDDIVMAGIAGSALIWLWGWAEMDAYSIVLTLFLLFAGICTAVILWQARRVLKTILQGEPFSTKNAVSLKRAAVAAFLIAAAALARVVWSVWHYRSAAPLATYNALFVPLFAMFGLLCLVMSALFRQAAELKAENDLTI